MAAWVRREGNWHPPERAALERAVSEHEAPFDRPVRTVEPIRDALFACMWDDVGVLRYAAGLTRAIGSLDALADELAACGVADGDRAFNLSWHDWINLRNLIATSQVIARAALAREDSRGAHFREDFPLPGSLEDSSFIVVRGAPGGALALERVPVRFTRVQPGRSLIDAASEPAAA
jgi:fumarate reductase flavoprotein subunit